MIIGQILNLADAVELDIPDLTDHKFKEKLLKKPIMEECMDIFSAET
jgi:hypothetical protein